MSLSKRINWHAFGPRGAIRVAEKKRNRKCPCGSGKRAKSCCEKPKRGDSDA